MHVIEVAQLLIRRMRL